MQVAYTYSSIRQIWEAIKKFFLEEIPKLTAQKVARQILPSSDGFSTLYGASFQEVSVLLPDWRATYSSTALRNVRAAEIADGSFLEEPSS